MNCLKCGTKRGVWNWHLSRDDFDKRGIIEDRFDVEACLCGDCFTDCDQDVLDRYVFSYWKNLKLTELGLQQDHDLAEQPTQKHYYNWHSEIECVKVSQKFSSNLGQAIQYIWRSETLNPNAVTKGQSIDEIVKDLEKAQAFIQFEIDRLRGN